VATSTPSGAVYDIGIYGTDVYGVASISILVDGVQGTCTTDSGVVIEADANHVVIGVSAAGAVGQVGTVGEAVVLAAGVEATGAVGTITQVTVNRVPVTGVAATGELGTLTFVCEANIGLDSVSGTITAGTVVAIANAVVVATAPTQLTGSIGTGFTIFENEVQVPTGVSTISSIGSVTITTTAFNYQAVREQYSRNRTVRVRRRTTSGDRTIYV
jgi:hypothetical protein